MPPPQTLPKLRLFSPTIRSCPMESRFIPYLILNWNSNANFSYHYTSSREWKMTTTAFLLVTNTQVGRYNCRAMARLLHHAEPPGQIGLLHAALHVYIQYADKLCDTPVLFCCNFTTGTAIRCHNRKTDRNPNSCIWRNTAGYWKWKLLRFVTAKKKTAPQWLAVASNGTSSNFTNTSGLDEHLLLETKASWPDYHWVRLRMKTPRLTSTPHGLASWNG